MNQSIKEYLVGFENNLPPHKKGVRVFGLNMEEAVNEAKLWNPKDEVMCIHELDYESKNFPKLIWQKNETTIS